VFIGVKTAMENLARYIIRASFSQERMSYVEEDGIVVYRSKDGAEQKVFDALEWLVPPLAGCSHVPDKAEQMVRSYGYYIQTTMFPAATGTSRTKTASYRASSHNVHRGEGGTMMPGITRSRPQKVFLLAIVVLCSTWSISGCQTVPTKANSDRLLEMITAEKESQRCRDYDFQVVVNGQKEVIRGKACARAEEPDRGR